MGLLTTRTNGDWPTFLHFCTVKLLACDTLVLLGSHMPAAPRWRKNRSDVGATRGLNKKKRSDAGATRGPNKKKRSDASKKKSLAAQARANNNSISDAFTAAKIAKKNGH